MTVADSELDMIAFLVTRWTGDLVNTAPDEHDEIGWFGPGELRELDLAHPESLPDLIGALQRAAAPGIDVT